MGKVKHIECEDCIVNIREEFHNAKGEKTTSVEIITDEGWRLVGSINNRVIKGE